MERSEQQKEEQTVSAYADESITDEVVVCAAAIFPLANVAAAQTALMSMKAALGLSSEVPLHCRVIFNANARRGTPWESIPPEAIHRAIETLCQNLTSIGLQPVVYVAKPSHLFIPGPPGAESKSTSLDVKGQAAMGFQMISFHLTNVYGFGACTMWIDPDTTKIPWLGGGRMQANATRSGFMDLGADIEPPRFVPLIERNPKPMLLELADLYAYVSARAHSAKGGWKNRWFQMVYSIINAQRLTWDQTNHDPKWESVTPAENQS